MTNIRDVLEEGRFYHIFNHACGDEDLFRTPENYRFFLKKYQKYIDPIAETYAYCLMPNHFHLLVRIKEMKDITNKRFVLEKDGRIDFTHAFGTLFNSYAKSYNQQYGRKGSLFFQSFKRIHVCSEVYLRRLIIYIHMNPVCHEFVDHPSQWEFSSYNPILFEQTYLLQSQTVIEMFDDKENLIFNHKPDMSLESDWTLEKP